jgi:hypothetical protein
MTGVIYTKGLKMINRSEPTIIQFDKLIDLNDSANTVKVEEVGLGFGVALINYNYEDGSFTVSNETSSLLNFST